MAETKRLPFLGRRRAKVKKSPTEWIETLLPVDVEGADSPSDAANASGVPAAELDRYAPTTPAYVPPSERAPGLPDERTLQSLRAGYVARSPMSIDQIHAYIDDHLASKRLPPPMRPRRAPPPIAAPPKRGKPVKIVGVPVAGDVVDQKIVYETPGGYVLEVAEKRPDGTLERAYYTISKVDHVAHALDALRTGGRPDTKPGFGSSATPAPSFEEAKRLVEGASPPTPGEAAPAPLVGFPGEPEPVHHRRHREHEPTEPVAPAPEHTLAEFTPAMPAPEPETPPQEEAKGRFGKLAGKLKFRKKDEEAAEPWLPESAATAKPVAEPTAEDDEKKGRFKGLFGKKKAEEPAPANAAAQTTGTPTEPTPDTEASEKDEGGRFSRLKKLRFGKKKQE